MDFKNMNVGEMIALAGGGQWQGENQSLFDALQAHTVATAGAVLYEVATQRDVTGRVTGFTVTRIQ